MKQTYIGPQHSYERIEGELRERFIERAEPLGILSVERATITSIVSEMAGGDYEENAAYAEGFVRSYFRETAPNMDNSYCPRDGIPGIDEPTPRLDKHIQNGWINGRNTRRAVEAS